MSAKCMAQDALSQPRSPPVLEKGLTLEEAVGAAKKYVTDAIRALRSRSSHRSRRRPSLTGRS